MRACLRFPCLRPLVPLVVLAAALCPLAASGDDPLGEPPPPISFIEVSVSSSDLLVGEVAQVTVIGTFADGVVRDVTADPATSFNPSPQAAVEIADDGTLTALAAADVTIYVDYGGFSSFASDDVELRVRQPGDRDADGLPDDYELAHALDPDFAGDAEQDPDADALTNLGEHAAGTDPRLADTDGDFEPDGWEVAVGTDPLLPDAPPQPPPPPSLLDDSCVVSALNRSARVQPDGVWVLPNVPANSGLVRVRATCVEDGVTRSGQSDYFAVPANGTIEIADIRFDDPEPVPATLTLTAPVTALTEAGQSVQLTATVTYPDGSSEERTAGATGTSYASSNPAIAEVTADGVVTARVSGNVLISALNEGALGVVRLPVVLSGDSDGDGLPDDFEIANGLDPNDPLDVLDDADGDGLSTGDEFLLGLDPFDADSDDDRLGDGEEVTVYGTDPLLRDTDGDGISDGLEVESGSDPLDPTSFNLGPILQALEVFPAAFDLVFNTAVGEASRRLEVSGRLIDDSTLDLRTARYGTQYSSSDLTVASFGSEAGRVFAGQDGTAVITVSNSGRTATAEVTVTTFAPTALSFLPLSGYPNGVDVADGYAYVASGYAGLHVVDVTDPERPLRLATRDTPGNANDVRVAGVHAYVADGAAGLVIVDVSDPRAPFIAGSLDTPGVATDLVVDGDRVFVADGAAGVVAIDVSDPTAPFELGRVDTPGNARGIDAADGLVVVADAGSGLQVVDAGDPAAMTIVGSTHTRAGYSRAADVALRGGMAYVADGSGSLGGLKVVDLRQPTTPVVVGATNDAFGLSGVVLDDRFVLASDYYFPNAVPIFDVGLPLPTFTAVLDFSRAPSFRDDNGNGIAAADGLVYMVGTRYSILDNGSYGYGGLHIGRYRQQQDNEGIAPEVAIVEPAEGFAVLERRAFQVRVEASDDVRVSAVRFLVDGEVVAERRGTPYEATLTAPLGTDSFSLGAEAVDLGGNVGVAEPVVVALLPDADPVVELLSPNAVSPLIEGGLVDVAATASDDSAVTAVEILLDGAPVANLTAPPYRVEHAIPLGVTSLSVEVRATDDVGQVATTGAVVFPVADDPPPTAFVVEPVDGSQVTEGATLPVIVGAFDDLGVARAGVVVDGSVVLEDFTAPYEVEVEVPVGVSELTLEAFAVDGVGQQSTAEAVSVVVVPDPGTTVIGSVELDGLPVAGAAVVCDGLDGVSGEDGSFALAGVPTIDVTVACSASYVDELERPFTGTSAAVRPIPAATTDVGVIAVVESLFEPDLGPSLNLADDQAVFRALPFAFPFFGASYTGVWINTNGNFTFTTASPRDWTEDAGEFVSGFRDLDGVEVGPAIAAFWDDLEPLVSASSVERDLFRFTGSAGDAVAAEVRARRDGSPLDPVLTLSNAAGATLAFNDDFFGLDSRLSLVLPADGTYYLEVESYSGVGGEGYFYTLALEGGGVPLSPAGNEIEPNDTFSTASPMAYGDVVSAVLTADASATTRNIHVNDQIPGRYIVTWNGVPEYPGVGSNTIQAILFEDGRIQFGYEGMTADDAIVGVSPSNGAPPLEVDFSADAPFSSSGAVAIFEEYDGPFGPDGTGEDPPGTTPFDLDGAVLVFRPNADGGFDVAAFGAGTGGGAEPPPAALQVGLARRTAAATLPETGVVEARVLPRDTGSVEGLAVTVVSSTDAAFAASAVTDAFGRVRIEGVPLGGVRAMVEEPGTADRRAAGVLTRGGEVLQLTLRPAAAKPKGE